MPRCHVPSSATRRQELANDHPATFPPASRVTDGDLSGEALVRIPVGVAGEGVSTLPPAPPRPDITASFSSPAVAAEHAETLERLGYHVVGAETPQLTASSGSAQHPAVFHVLVPRSARESHPAWWRQLTALADRAYSLAFGPVQACLSDVLRAHLAPPR